MSNTTRRTRIVAIGLAAVATVGFTLAVAGAGAAATAEPIPSNEYPASSEYTDSNEAYAGSHVAFETESNAVTNYEVAGEGVFESVEVESQSEYDGQAGAGADVTLDLLVDLEGAAVQLGAQSETRAEVAVESGATVSAQDRDRAILTVTAEDESQYVQASVDGEATAESDGDAVVIEGDERTGALVVAGDGEVTVNEEGDVVAELEQDATLVFRSSEERDEDDRAQEELIAEGSATVEAYAEQRADEQVSDGVNYAQDVAVETSAEAENELEVTVERTTDEGTILIATVEEETVGTLEDLEVTVDGEAAVEASSYSELEGGIGEEPRYMVVTEGGAEASADVLIAIDGFSERQATISGDEEAADDADHDGADDTDDADDTADDGVGMDDDELPGFGVAIAVLATLLAAVTHRLRS